MQISTLDNPLTIMPGRRRVLRPLSAVALGLLAACGQRYELGKLEELDTEHPIDSVAVSQVVIEELQDGDATLPDEAAALWSSRGVGDVDGDGHGDWVAASPVRLDHADRNDLRIVYGAPRPPNGVLASNLGPIVSEPGTTASRFPAAAGDVDGDGYADILWSSSDYMDLNPATDPASYFGKPNLRQHEQRAYLSYGSPSRDIPEVYLPDDGVTFDPLSALRGALQAELAGLTDAQAQYYAAGQGIELASVGDLDADGFGDFAVTYYFSWNGVTATDSVYTEYTDAGERTAAVTAVFYGSPERLTGEAWAARSAELPDVKRVSPVGDIDGDGYPEFAAQLEGGQTYVLSGSAARLSGTVSPVQAGVRVVAAEGGSTVEAAGDMDGDGFAELVVIAPFGDDTSAAYLFYGGPERLNDPFVAEYADAAFVLGGGMSGVMAIGDWNGDGTGDLLASLGRINDALIGTDGESPFRAAASIIPGNSQRYSGVYVTPVLDDSSLDTLESVSLTPLGDVDGDGLADVQFVSEGGTSIKYGGALGGSIQ